jgi:hypothetical protein
MFFVNKVHGLTLSIVKHFISSWAISNPFKYIAQTRKESGLFFRFLKYRQENLSDKSKTANTVVYQRNKPQCAPDVLGDGSSTGTVSSLSMASHFPLPVHKKCHSGKISKFSQCQWSNEIFWYTYSCWVYVPMFPYFLHPPSQDSPSCSSLLVTVNVLQLLHHC